MSKRRHLLAPVINQGYSYYETNKSSATQNQQAKLLFDVCRYVLNSSCFAITINGFILKLLFNSSGCAVFHSNNYNMCHGRYTMDANKLKQIGEQNERRNKIRMGL